MARPSSILARPAAIPAGAGLRLGRLLSLPEAPFAAVTARSGDGGELHDVESAETIGRRVAELEAQQVQATPAEQPLVASAPEADTALPVDTELQAPEPIMLGSEVAPGAPPEAVPDVPVRIITEVIGRGGRSRAAARVVDGDIPPNSQLGFGWLLTT